MSDRDVLGAALQRVEEVLCEYEGSDWWHSEPTREIREAIADLDLSFPDDPPVMLGGGS